MKAKLRKIVPLLVLAIAMTLSGCKLETPMTQSKITKEFLNNTESVQKARQIQIAKAQNTSKKSKKFNVTFDKQAKKEQKKVQKSVKLLEKNSKYSGYPEDVYLYSKDVLTFINAVIKGTSNENASKLFHKATRKAITVASDTDNKKVTRYVGALVANDPLMRARVSKNLKKGDKVKQSTTKPKAKPKNIRRSNIDVNYGWGTAILILCVLIIATIFMQPNKSDDNSDALMDESLKPKPRGYTLLMLRSTEVLSILLVIIMITMNMI